jgi:hypothetical protein
MLMSLSVSMSAQAEPTVALNQAHGTSYTVNVQQVVPASSSQGKLYRVKYDYEFKDRDSVSRSLAIHVVAVVTVFSKGGIYPDDLTSMLGKIAATFGAPLAVIVGGLVGARGKHLTVGAFVAALLCAIVWNAILLVRTLLFAHASEDSISEWSRYFEVAGAGFGSLVSGPLSYFFARSPTEGQA